MPWPSKYGTASMQSGTPPTPPPEREESSHAAYAVFGGGVLGNMMFLSPSWFNPSDPSATISYTQPDRPGGPFTVGVFYPSVTDGTDRRETLLNVQWPKAAVLPEGKEVNQALELVTIESRPQGSVSWRTNSTTVLFDKTLTVARVTGPGQAYSFTAASGDEYRAFAKYSTSLDPYYSPVISGSAAIPVFRPTVYSFTNTSVSSGAEGIVNQLTFKTAVSLLLEEAEVRTYFVQRSGCSDADIGDKFFITFADRLTSDQEIRTPSICRGAVGNTTTILSFGQWV